MVSQSRAPATGLGDGAKQGQRLATVRKVLGHVTADMTQHHLGVGLDAKRALVEGVAKLISDAKQAAMGTAVGVADDLSAN